MPTEVSQAPYTPVPQEPPRKLWTRIECVALEESGVWAQQKLELIEGELISKMGKKRPHVNALVAMQAWLIEAFGAEFVNPETPIDISPEDNPTNEPEPDLILLGRPSQTFLSNPKPGELRLVVEIGDSSLRFDLTAKARLYARAGIIEYWVVDVEGQRIIVHREPRDGRYQNVISYAESESISPLAAPDRPLAVGTIFRG
jgi:Uma2 family endonuclease